MKEVVQVTCHLRQLKFESWSNYLAVIIFVLLVTNFSEILLT